MKGYRDQGMEDQINNLIIESIKKRDKAPSNSDEKRYYRKLSKNLQKIEEIQYRRNSYEE